MMVGRLLSLWDGIFSGAMLNFQGVIGGIYVGFSCNSLEHFRCRILTLPKTNKALRNWQCGNYIPFAKPYFQVRTVSFRESTYNYRMVFRSPPETSVLSTPPLGWRIWYDVGIIPAEMFNRYELDLHTRNCGYRLHQELIATPIRQKSQRYGKWIFRLA